MRVTMHISLHSLLLLCCIVIHILAADDNLGDLSSNDVSHILSGMETAAEQALSVKSSSAAKFTQLSSDYQELLQEFRQMQQLEKELLQRTFALEELIKKANAVQLKYLAWQMNETIQKELQERKVIAKEAFAKQQEQKVDTSNIVTHKQLEQATDPTQLLKESEQQLETWILNLIEEEIAAYHAEMVEACSSGKCVTPIEAAHLVQESLTMYANDGINMPDYAEGAKIVYEFTSETYDPPPQDANELLGNVWWRSYIPQDWERMLPSGWEEWKAGVPSFLKQSLGLKSDTVPPEVIFTPSTLPGSCWPMKGQSGQVTMRLRSPVSVTSITIYHASSLLVGDDKISAPRRLRVIAYPPCNDDDDNCNGIGFDVNKAWELTAFDYDVEGRPTQTFDVPIPAASCSEEAPSCEAEAEPIGKLHVASSSREAPAAAITLVVEDNWGKDEYTCLYRFRVHGNVHER